VLRATVVAAAGAGLVVAATQVPGAVAVGSSAPARAGGGAQSGPIRGSQLLCAGPELVGVPGVHDLPVGVRVAAAAAPASALGDTQPVVTPGSLTLTGMPGAGLGQPGSARGRLVTAGLTSATGAVVAGTQSLAPGLAAAQSWLVTSGDQRSLGSAPCTPPGADLWLVAGGSAAGRQERLVLTNPGGNPVSVDVTLHGPNGPVDTAIGKGLVVAPHGRTSFLLDSISGTVASPAVHVVTQGGVVGAVLNDTWLNGTTPAGSDDASPSAPASRDQVVPGVDVSGGRAVLRVVVPGPAEAVVQARVLTSQGPRGLPSGAVTRVPGGSVRDIDISGLPAGASGLQVRADVPVVASATFQRNGTKSSDFAWAVSTDPITGVAGMPFPQTPASQRTVWLTATAGSVVADVLSVGSAGTVTTQRVTVPADSAIAVAVPSAAKAPPPTSVWVRPVSGSGRLRGAVDSSVKDARGVLVTSTPLLDSALQTTTVGVRALPN
jgi:hypothetical protein